jgi:putative ABC transport system permease protein
MDWHGTMERAASRVRAVPGVSAAAIGGIVPFSGRNNVDVRIDDGRPDDAQPDGGMTIVIGADYFRAMGVPIVAGRAFDADDRAGAPSVAIVSSTFARRYWPGSSPVGRCVAFSKGNSYGRALGDGCTEVVGVAGDVKYDELLGVSSPIVYTSAPQMAPETLQTTLFVSAEGTLLELIGPIRAAVQSVDPSMPYPRVQTMRAHIDRWMFRWDVAFKLFSVLGTLAAVLGAIGVYGLVAFLSEQRGRELGIRAAIGAGRGRLVRLVVWDGIRVSAVGLAVGAASALVFARLLASQLHGTSWMNPTTYLAVAAGLLAISVAAALRPALRASRADPVVVLREE